MHKLCVCSIESSDSLWPRRGQARCFDGAGEILGAVGGIDQKSG